MSERLNITTLAEMANLSRDRARDVLKMAGIKRDTYRLYDAEQAMKALTAFTDSNMASGNHLAGRGSDYSGSGIEALAAARASAEIARARKVELEVAQKEGRLVTKQAVIEAATDFATLMRNGLLGLGSRISTRCVGRSADEISTIIEDAIADALADLSDVDNYLLKEVAP